MTGRDSLIDVGTGYGKTLCTRFEFFYKVLEVEIFDQKFLIQNFLFQEVLSYNICKIHLKFKN